MVDFPQIDSAVILSAGYGKRLSPITDAIPKPLFPIANTPALELIIKKLKNASIRHFYFNTFHLSDQVTNFLNEYTDIVKTVVREPFLRNTGGGIANFSDLLQEKSFLLHNCDIYCEQNIGELIEFHFQRDAVATLMVIDFPMINSIVVKDDRVVSLRTQQGNYTYSGIAVFSPKIWKYFPNKDVFSIIEVLHVAMDHQETVAAYRSDAYWSDFGTPQQYMNLHRHLAQRKNDRVHPTATFEKSLLQGYSFIGEHAYIYDAVLNDCIVFPHTRIVSETKKNCIIYSKSGVNSYYLVEQNDDDSHH